MPLIKFFGISKETMTDVKRNLKKGLQIEKLYQAPEVVITSLCYHHPKLDIMLTTEDYSFEDVFDFILPTTLEMTDIRPSTYVTCLYNSFWWV